MERARSLLRAVVDTSIFVSGSITKVGIPHAVLLAWRAGGFTLLLSQPQRAEIDDVVHRPAIADKYGLTPGELADLLFILDATAIPVVPRRRLPLAVRDPKDEHLLAAALGGRADYLVTGDDDLLVLDGDARLGPLRIITPRAFLDLLQSQELRARHKIKVPR